MTPRQSGRVPGPPGPPYCPSPVATSMTCQGDRYDAKGHRFFECARTDTATYFTLSGEEVVLCPECADREQRENTQDEWSVMAAEEALLAPEPQVVTGENTI